MHTKRNMLFHKRKPSNEEEELTIMDLPSVIMVDILSRLPLRSIFSCKCVCKPWCTLLCDRLFATTYHTRPSPSPCILLSDVEDFVYSILELNAGYDYESDPFNRPIILLSNLYHDPHFSQPRLKLFGSCNGFLCLLSGFSLDRYKVHVSNPILGEYFELPLPGREIGSLPVAYGFCFSENSGRYKVLRSVYKIRVDGSMETVLEVYTLGDDIIKWRNVGKAPMPVGESFGDVIVNGFLHWITGEKVEGSHIYSFDISGEKVKSIPPPSGLKTKDCNYLAVLGNCLCLISGQVLERKHYTHIWKMNEYGISESWTKCYNLRIMPDFWIYKPLVVWKDGEILMQQLVSYSPNEKQSREVGVYPPGFAVARYVPSFYSLKTVIGESFQVSHVKKKKKSHMFCQNKIV